MSSSTRDDRGGTTHLPVLLAARVDDDTIAVDLDDGRTLSVPLAWFPRLMHGTKSERTTFRIIGRGDGLHWPELDEDISVAGMLAGHHSMESPQSLERWLAGRGRSSGATIPDDPGARTP